MAGYSHRVAHIVQAVEEADQVEGTAERGRTGNVDGDSVTQTKCLGVAPSGENRRFMEVESVHSRRRECLGENGTGMAKSATDIGDAAPGSQLLRHAGHRRDPISNQVRSVARAEETGGSGVETFMVIAPCDLSITLERSDHLRKVDIHGLEHADPAGEKCR